MTIVLVCLTAYIARRLSMNGCDRQVFQPARGQNPSASEMDCSIHPDILEVSQ